MTWPACRSTAAPAKVFAPREWLAMSRETNRLVWTLASPRAGTMAATVSAVVASPAAAVRASFFIVVPSSLLKRGPSWAGPVATQADPRPGPCLGGNGHDDAP